MLDTLRKTLLRLWFFVPSKLPQGVAEFNAWSDQLLDVYGMPNNDSMKFALAVCILHLNATDAYKPREYFGRTLIKGAASQVAGGIMQELKARQAEEMKRIQDEMAAAQAKQQEEAKAQEAAANEQKTVV